MTITYYGENATIETPLYEVFNPYDILNETSRDAIKQAFKEVGLGVNDDEAESLINLLIEYHGNRSMKIYDRLPESLKKQILMWSNQSRKDRRAPVFSTERIAKYILDEFVNNKAFDFLIQNTNTKIQNESAKIMNEMHETYSQAYEEIFSQIDEIRETNPIQAERIQKIKDAFDKANSIEKPIADLQMYLESDKRKNIKRYVRDFAYTLKQTNLALSPENTGYNIKVPDMNTLYEVVKSMVEPYGFKTNNIKAFMVLMCKSFIDTMSNAKESSSDDTLAAIAYIYRFCDNLYKFKFVNNPDDHTYIDFSTNICLGMDKMIEYGQALGITFE